MTDQFISESGDNQNQQQEADRRVEDNPNGGEGSNADTHSPEYQLQKMQQRLADKDEFISTLKSENQSTRELVAQMQERVQNMESIQEVLDKGKDQAASDQDTGLDEDALVGKVIDNLSQREADRVKTSNYESAVARLKQEYGDAHVNDKVKAAAEANGLSVSYMLDTAKQSPQAFYSLMGLNAKQENNFQQPTRGSANVPSTNQEKDFAYFSRLMRENPREYWKPDTQREFRKLFNKNN